MSCRELQSPDWHLRQALLSPPRGIADRCGRGRITERAAFPRKETRANLTFYQTLSQRPQRKVLSRFGKAQLRCIQSELLTFRLPRNACRGIIPERKSKRRWMQMHIDQGLVTVTKRSLDERMALQAQPFGFRKAPLRLHQPITGGFSFLFKVFARIFRATI